MPDASDSWGKRHARRCEIQTGRVHPGGPPAETRQLHDPKQPDFDRKADGIRILEALAASGLRSIR
jgi:tRNA G26 N,N-dimethylase Trm1